MDPNESSSPARTAGGKLRNTLKNAGDAAVGATKNLGGAAKNLGGAALGAAGNLKQMATGTHEEERDAGPHDACSCCPTPTKSWHRFTLGFFFCFSCCIYPIKGSRNVSFGGVLASLWLVICLIAAAVTYAIEGSAEALDLGLEFPVPAANATDITWTFGSSLYFTIITFTSVGFGDLSPATPGGMVWVIISGTIGLGLTAALTGTLASYFTRKVEQRESRMLAKLKGTRLGDNRCIHFIEANRVTIVVFTVVLILLIGGAFIFGYGEPLGEEAPVDNRFIIGLFYTFTVLTTIGYGAQNVVNEWSRAIVVIMSIVGIALYGFIVEKVASSSGSSFVARQTRLRSEALGHADDLAEVFPELNPEGKRLVLQKIMGIEGIAQVAAVADGQAPQAIEMNDLDGWDDAGVLL